MRKHFMALLLLSALPVFAAATRDSVVVDVAWLAAHLDDPNLVLLHVGDKGEYDRGHIPGAIYVSLKDVSVSDPTPQGLMLEMPAPTDLRHCLESIGISNKSHVVVYYGKDWVSPSTRIIFTLAYAGLGDRASLLDGGMPAWIAAGRTVTTDVPPSRKGTLAELRIDPIVVDAAFVRAHLGTPGFAIVDGRDAVFYDGVERGEDHSGKQRAGHIAGAHSFPFTQLVDENNRLRANGDLAALFAKAGVKPEDTVIGYCHIGQQATAMLFAARLLGHRVLLYDASFQDWSRHSDYAVENPAETSK